MPAPDPDALWIEEENGRLKVVYEAYLWTGNHGNRRARAIAIFLRLQRGDWKCRACGGPIPAFRRTDARYCRESCRKRAKRRRMGIGATG